MVLRTYCRIKGWWVRQEGANMVEYVLIAALIAIVVMATMTEVGEGLKSALGKIRDKLPK